MNILALNGGGMRGALQVGALKEIAQESAISLVERFSGGIYGYSIGALIATLIAFDFDLDAFTELTEILGNMQDTLNPIRLQTLLSFTEKQGVDDGAKIKEVLKEAFQKRGLNLDTLRVGDASVPLHIIASDLTDLKLVIFGKNMMLWDALRASFSIPYIFTPHVIQGHTFVDGAVLCQNIMRIVPQEQRKNTLFLLNAQSRTITPQNYLSSIPFMKNIKETHEIRDKYPNNTCLLIEDDSKMFSLWNSTQMVDHLLAVGRIRYQEFRSQRRCQELP